MSFFKKIGKGLKKATKFVAKTAGKAVNGVAKIAKASGIPVISQIGGVVDAVIPDEKVQKMAEKAVEQGVTKVDKIEETVANLAPNASASEVARVTKTLASAVSSATGTPINDANAVVSKMSFMDTVKEYAKKPLTWIVAGGVLIGGYLMFNGKKSKW